MCAVLLVCFCSVRNIQWLALWHCKLNQQPPVILISHKNIQCSCCSHTGSKSEDERSLCLFLSLFLSVILTCKQINKSLKLLHLRENRMVVWAHDIKTQNCSWTGWLLWADPAELKQSKNIREVSFWHRISGWGRGCSDTQKAQLGQSDEQTYMGILCQEQINQRVELPERKGQFQLLSKELQTLVAKGFIHLHSHCQAIMFRCYRCVGLRVRLSSEHNQVPRLKAACTPHDRRQTMDR